MRIYGFWQPRYLLTTPFGPFVNRNHFAGWMLLVLPFTVACLLGAAEHGLLERRGTWRDRLLWLSSPRGGQLQLMALAVLVMGLSLVMSQSRSGVICFTLAMAAGAVAGRRRYRSNTARLGIVGALTLLLVLSVVCSDVRVSDRFALRATPRAEFDHHAQATAQQLPGMREQALLQLDPEFVVDEALPEPEHPFVGAEMRGSERV